MNHNEYLLGLIGYPLSHSFSKKYFAKKIEQLSLKKYYYELFPLEKIEMFPALVTSRPDLKGLNVTIPYKETVIPYLDELDEEANAIQAVNTIKITGNKLVGYNSDIYGFRNSLIRFLGKAQVNRAMILGSGGSSKAVVYVLQQLGLDVIRVSRTEKPGYLTYKKLTEEHVQSCPLIINTTPLGMFPKIDSSVDIPYHALGPDHFLYDLVYNPEITTFMQKGRDMKAKVKNGLEMLQLQAEKSWSIWQDIELES